MGVVEKEAKSAVASAMAPDLFHQLRRIPLVHQHELAWSRIRSKSSRAGS